MAKTEWLYDSPFGGVYSAGDGGYYVGNDYYVQLPELWAGAEFPASASYQPPPYEQPVYEYQQPQQYVDSSAGTGVWSPQYLYDSPAGGVYGAQGGGYYVGNDYYQQLPDLWGGMEFPAQPASQPQPYSTAPEYLYDSPAGGVYGPPSGGYYVGNDYYQELPDLWAGAEFPASTGYQPQPYSTTPEYLYDSPAGGVYGATGGGYYVGNDYYEQLPDLWAGTEFPTQPAYQPLEFVADSPAGQLFAAPGGGFYVDGEFTPDLPDLWAGLEFPAPPPRPIEALELRRMLAEDPSNATQMGLPSQYDSPDAEVLRKRAVARGLPPDWRLWSDGMLAAVARGEEPLAGGTSLMPVVHRALALPSDLAESAPAMAQGAFKAMDAPYHYVGREAGGILTGAGGMERVPVYDEHGRIVGYERRGGQGLFSWLGNVAESARHPGRAGEAYDEYLASLPWIGQVFGRTGADPLSWLGAGAAKRLGLEMIPGAAALLDSGGGRVVVGNALLGGAADEYLPQNTPGRTALVFGAGSGLGLGQVVSTIAKRGFGSQPKAAVAGGGWPDEGVPARISPDSEIPAVPRSQPGEPPSPQSTERQALSAGDEVLDAKGRKFTVVQDYDPASAGRPVVVDANGRKARPPAESLKLVPAETAPELALVNHEAVDLAPIAPPQTELARRVDEFVEAHRDARNLLHLEPDEIRDVYKTVTGRPYVGDPRLSIDDWSYAAENGLENTNWYRQAVDILDEQSGGRLDEAMVVFAITSQKVPPAENMARTFSVMAAVNDLTAGGTRPLRFEDLQARVGYGTPDRLRPQQVQKLVDVYELGTTGTAGSYAKTPSFYQNLLSAADGTASPFTSVDTHHASYGGMPDNASQLIFSFLARGRPRTAEAYDLMDRLTKQLAREYGWPPFVVQSAMWKTMKNVKEADGGRWAKALDRGDISWRQAVDGSKHAPFSGSFSEVLSTPRVQDAIDRYWESIARFPPPKRGPFEYEYRGSGRKTTASRDYRVNSELGAELRADVESNSPLVTFAAGRLGNGAADMDSLLGGMGYDPVRRQFQDLLEQQIPHEVVNFGIRGGDGLAPTVSVRLAGGNADTADFVAAHFGKKLEALGAPQRDLIVEWQGSHKGNPGLALDHPDGRAWSVAELAAIDQAMADLRLDGVVAFTTATGSSNTLHFSHSNDIPSFSNHINSVVQRAGFDPRRMRIGSASYSFIKADDYERTLARLGRRFDPRGELLRNRTNPQLYREANDARTAAVGRGPNAGRRPRDRSQGVPDPGHP